MNGYITWMNATLHYANGRRVSIRKVMLHHIVFLNDGRPNNEPGGSCKGRKGEPFYGTGEEREQLLLPKGYGYPVHAHDRWRMQTMLMSHSFQAANVYVQLHVQVHQEAHDARCARSGSAPTAARPRSPATRSSSCPAASTTARSTGRCR